jgi:cytochrome c553
MAVLSAAAAIVASLSVAGGLPELRADEPTLQQQRVDDTFFESKVRPLLVAHCVECHGPDDQSGELRLDRKTHFDRGGGSGPLVAAGDPQASLLIRAIGYRDNALQMPPDGKLSDEAIATLTEWVRRGAHWPAEESPADDSPAAELSMEEQIAAERQSHWSYQPIARPQPPTVPGSASAIDRFVRARLAEAELAPNPQADRRTLIERAYFTLLGLPPTHEEVQNFERDARPDAFARLVDRLLASPRYGERWARHWLDLARYGDTMGYLPGSREERYPFAFTFRDYVIDAFNTDKPYDQFVREQLAADQLDLQGESQRALAAMGYLTVGRKFMNRRHDIIDDQIDVVTRGFLGLSVSCARCHDHKYDPIPTADYYSLYGVFASSREPDELPLLGEPQPSAAYQAFLDAKAAEQAKVDQWLEERRVETEQELRSKLGDYLVYTAEQLPAYRRDDQKPLQGRRGPLRRAAVQNWQQFLLDAKRSPEPTWQLLRELAQLPAESFAERAVGLIEQAAAGEGDAAVPARLTAALRDGQPQSLPAAAAIFGEVLEAVHAESTKATATTAEPPEATGEQLVSTDTAPADAAPRNEGAAAEQERLRQLLVDPEAPTTLDRDGMIAHLDQAQRNRYNQLLNAVNGVEVTHPGAPPRGMVLVDRDRPVEPVIFRRGEPRNRGDRVPRRFLQVLEHVDGGEPFEQGSGRLELAHAITDPDNPLTARVIVNRLWQHHFGEGLVRTPSDFGERGERPTHPQLLDYLASELLQSGWSLKHVQRKIMLSATWQQSSTTREEAMLADPENRLLWHMPRQRLEFEALRDRLLVAAGRLDGRIGGRSVKIHEDAPRRGLYAYIDREDFPGLLASFDVPSPDASRARRAETTVPQQALYLMNSPFVIEQAKAIAAQSTAASGPASAGQTDAIEDADAGDASRIRVLFRRTLCRDPRPDELQAALEFVGVTGGGAADQPPALDPWVQLAQVLLLSNEFAFVD